MPGSGFHRDAVGLDVHVPHSFTYADLATRVAAVSTDFTDPDDLFKLARQTSDTTYWVLEQITPSVTWNQLGGGGGATELPFDAITNPAVDAAVTTAKIDLFSGTVITLTAAGNSQTLQTPTDTTAGRKFFVLNNDTSTFTITVNGTLLGAGQYGEWRWDGTAWLFTSGGAAGGPGGLDSEIQYNNAGVLDGDANYTWDDVAKKETVLGDVEQVGGTPANQYTPAIISSIAVGLGARNSVALGNYVYVVDNQSDDLRIFDVTDPTAPALISTLAAVAEGRGVDIASRYIFIADAVAGGRLAIVDVQDKANPVLVGSVVTGGVPRGVKVSGNTAFVSSNGGQLISVDVTDVTNPVVLQFFATGAPNLRTEFDVVGDIAYVASSAAAPNFLLVDVSNPASMSTLASLDIGTAVWAVRAVGRYAYVLLEQTDPNPSFTVFDVSDPAATVNVPVGSLILNTGGTASPRALEVVGNFAYVVDALNNVLQVVDISDPTAPVLISTAAPIGQNPVSISTIGRFAYITDNTDDVLQIVDLGGLDAQNVNVGNVDAGAVNVRRDVKAAGSVNANAVLVGAGGIFSDGDAIAAGRRLGGEPRNVVEIYKEADFPIVSTDIVLATGTVYMLMSPISTDKQILHPDTGGAFSPAKIVSSNKELNTLTSTGTGGAFLRRQSGQGQLVLQNLIITNTGSRVFADVSGLTQTDLLTELDDTSLLDFNDGTVFDTCIFNANNAAFWTGSGTFTLIDAECNLADIFHANFTDTAKPAFRVQSSAATNTLLTVRDSKLSSQAAESFFMLHSNLVAGSTVRLTGIENSPFTPGTGAFFASETGSITSLADSPGAPGVRTFVASGAHKIADGDTIIQSGFATQTQNNGTFLVSNVVAGVSYEIVAVFVATDTGTWTNNSLDQTDPKVSVSDSPGQANSKTIGSFHVNSNTTVTVIATLNTYTDLNLGGNALAGSNIERWSLTNATTGELTYNGIEPFSGTIFAQLSTLGETGSPEYRFRAVKNGVALADGIETVREAGAVQIVTTGLVAPVSVVTGDTIRLQVNNIDDASDITISHLSVSIQ